MAAAHAIETLSFDIGFATEAQARDQHERLGDFAGRRSLAIIDEVFDEVLRDLRPGGETIRLDLLEVDLGETPEDWADAEDRLRTALRSALRAAIGPRLEPGSADKVPAPATPRDADSELDVVWNHLHHGLLPWSADPSDGEALAAVVLRVMTARGADLAARLLGSPARGRLIARLSRQWPQAALEALAARLAQASGRADRRPAAAAQDRPEPAATADAWASRLLALTGGRTAPEPGTAALPPLVDAAWPALINGEPAAVRARLRAVAGDASSRARLAGLLTEARLVQLLSLWGAAADTAFVAAVMAAVPAWRLGVAASTAVLETALRTGLVVHLLEEAGDRLDVAAAVASLVAARARLDGLAPARVARALARGWPATGPGGPQRQRLRADLAEGFEGADVGAAEASDAPPAEPAAPRRWRFEVGESGAPAAAEPMWRERFDAEPSGLAAYLRRHGRVAAWRRRLARDLTPERLDEILALWCEPADAAFLAAILAAPDAWRLDGTSHAGADLRVRLRVWLLDDLLLTPPGPPRAAKDLIRNLVRRRAEFDDLPPSAVAAALAAAWAGEAGRGAVEGPGGRLRELLSDDLPSNELRSAAGAHAAADIDAVASVDASAEAVADRQVLVRALAEGEIPAAAAVVARGLATDRLWLVSALPRLAAKVTVRTALVGALAPAQRFDLAQLWLDERQVRLVLALAPDAGDIAAWSAILAAGWSTNGPAPSRRSPGVTAGPDGDATDLSSRAAALLRHLRQAGVLEAAASFRLRGARAYVRAEVPPGSSRDIAPTPPSLAAWRGRLPATLSAAAARAIADLLSPAAAGLRQLADWSPGERRDLLLRLRPADAPGVLGTLEMLAQAGRVAGLAEPAGDWSAFGWQLALTELFEEGRAFEAGGLAARWFEAWAAATPFRDEPQARSRLAAALEAAQVRGPAAAASAPAGSDAAETLAGEAPADVAPDAAPGNRGRWTLGVAPDSTADGPGRGRPEVGAQAAGAAGAAEPDVLGRRGESASADPTSPASRRGQAAEDADSEAPARPAESSGRAAADAAPDTPLGPQAGELPGARAPIGPSPMGVAAGPGADKAQAPTSAGDANATSAPAAQAVSPAGLAHSPSELASDGSRPADPGPAAAEASHGRVNDADGEGHGPAASRVDPVEAEAAERTRLTDRRGATQGVDRNADVAPASSARAVSDPDRASVAARDGAGRLLFEPDPAVLAAALRGDRAAFGGGVDAAQVEPTPDGAIYVANAGVVLLGPYIPMLLNRLELTRDGRFVDEAAQERAVHVVQFVADGQRRPSAEHALPLNKLICGLDFRTPVGREFEVRDDEQALVEGLLQTVIQRWEILGRTSVSGLRETFLLRRGALTQDGEAWKLKVEAGPYDMLLDRIPWGYGTLKLPWMPQVLHVDWR